MASLGETCRLALKSQVGDKLSDDQIDSMVKRVLDKRAEMIRFGQIMDDPDAILKAVAKIADDEEVAALIEQRSRAINVDRLNFRRARIDGNPDDMVAAIKSTIEAVESPRDGYAVSAKSMIEAEQSAILGAFTAEMEKTGLMKVVADNNNIMKTSSAARKKFDNDTIIETARASFKRMGLEPKDAPTGNKTAEQLGEVYSKYLELVRVKRNDAGAWTRELPGYIPQKYDQSKVAKMTDSEFKALMERNLDSSTFNDIDDINMFLSHAKVGMGTGVHYKSGTSDWLNGFKGGSQNVAKRASAERVLHYQSARHWIEVNEQLGDGSIHEAVLFGMMKGGTDIGLMKMFGTNPRGAFLADVDHVKGKLFERSSNGDVAAEKQLKEITGKTSEGGWFTNLFDQLDGSANIAVNPTAANVMRGIRSYESMTKLGMSAVSGLSDLPARAAALQWHGQGFFSGLGKSISAIVTPMADNERNALARQMLSSMNGLVGDIASHLDAGNTINGKSSKLLNLFFTMNGQKFMTDRLRMQTVRDLWNSITVHSDEAFTALPEKMQISMRRYAITEQHWDYMRSNLMTDRDGVKYAASDVIMGESDDVIRKMMGKADASEREIARFKEDFERTWRGYFVGTTSESVTDPSLAARALVTGGTRPGTLSGELMRTVTQFKSYPVTMMLTHMNREMHRAGRANISGLLGMVIGMTTAGYMASVAKDILKGRTPKGIEDEGDMAKILMNSFMQGGSMGIMGDLIFYDWSKNNAGVSLLGPTAGSVADFGSILWAKNLGEDNWQSRAINVASNHIPFINLFYTKATWEFLVLHGLQESVNPGYLGRVERRMQRENNQSFLLPTLY